MTMSEPDQEKLCLFLLDAKRRTYAGKGAESRSSRPTSHDLRWRDGDWLYIDTYLGGELFSGEEAVWKNEQPIYAMNYSGRVIGEPFNGDFLKAALYAVPLDTPFRGPALFKDGDYEYHCTFTGDLSWFQGYEEICFCAERIYECYFHGGFVR